MKARPTVLAALCFAFAACGKGVPDKNDPNTPAVVKAPPPILPSDTEKKVVPPLMSNDVVSNLLARHYALVGASLTMRDPGLIQAEYAGSAELTTTNGSFVGIAAISKEYSRLAEGTTVKDFTRSSLSFHLVDSTVVDSGTYTIVMQRTPKESTIERGNYASTWRIQAPPLEWVMTKDHLYRAAKKPK